MKTNEELEEALEELKKEFYFFTKNGSSGGSSGGNTGTSKPTPAPDDDEGWTVLYDKDSDDPNINLGQTTGIHSNLGIIDSFPDLVNFTKIRFMFHVTNCLCNYDFYIPKFGYNEFHFMVDNALPNDFVSCNNYIKPDSNGKLVLGIGPIYRLFIYVTGNRFPYRTHCINEADTCYYQILVK